MEKYINNKKSDNNFFKILMIILISFISIFIIIEKVLNHFNMSFRFWLQCLIFCICLIGIILCIIKIYIKKEKVKNILKKVCILFLFLLIPTIIFGQYILFFILVFANYYNLNIEEYTIDTEYGKKVVYVQHFFDTKLKVHDYYNQFICSYNYDSEIYEGNLNISEIEEKLNKKNNLTDEKQKSKEEIIKNIKPEISESDEVLYKEKFGDVTIAIVSKGEWNNKHIVQILRSKESDNIWESMLQNEYGAIYASNNTEFKFFDEDFGYYLDNNVDEKHQELKYTSDGGRNFETVKLLIGETEIGDKEYIIGGLPLFENGKYKLKLNVYCEYGEKEYILYSENGISFELN